MPKLLNRIPKHILDMFKPKREVDPVKWANENLLIPKQIASVGQKYSTFNFPYQAGPLRAWAHKDIDKVTLVWGTQLGKTTTQLTIKAFASVNKPAPMLHVGANRESEKIYSETRMYPMFESTPILLKKLPPKHRRQVYYMNLDQMPIYLGWSGSLTSVAEKTVKYVFCSELDKWDRSASLEADPFENVQERVKAFPVGSKILSEGTPTIKGMSRIWDEWLKSDRRTYRVPCPHCGTFQQLLWNNLLGGKDDDGLTLPPDIAEKRAYYECNSCKKQIYNSQKMKMLRRGVWAREGEGVDKKGNIRGEALYPYRHAGFHLSTLYSNAVSWGAMLKKGLEAVKDPDKWQAFINSWLAEPWVQKVEGSNEDEIRLLEASYEEGIVPAGVKVLTAGVDIQKGHFWIVVRGWGLNEESWLIRSERIEGSYENMEFEVFKRQYKRADKGDPMQVRMACIDSGYEAEKVYRFCRKYRDRSRPVKGFDTLPGVSFRLTPVDKSPSTGKSLPGSVILVGLDLGYYKDRAVRLTEVPDGKVPMWHLYSGIDDEYIKQFCSEHKVLKRNKKTRKVSYIWETKTLNRANHLWDCEIYDLCAADLILVSQMRSTDGPTDYTPRRRKRKGWNAGSDSGGRKGGGWLDR